MCSCPNGRADTETFPVIELDLGNMVLYFEGKWYTSFFNNYYGYQDVCLVLFLNGGRDQTDYWLLGDPLLRAYLTIYDRSNNRIGFVGNTEA